jgi:hypothetical protein
MPLALTSKRNEPGRSIVVKLPSVSRKPCSPVLSTKAPTICPSLLMPRAIVEIASGTSISVKTPLMSYEAVEKSRAWDGRYPTICPESLMLAATVDRASGALMVVKLPPVSRNPCPVPVISIKSPTICPTLLMPWAWVSSAPGTSIVAKLPPVSRKSWPGPFGLQMIRRFAPDC